MSGSKCNSCPHVKYENGERSCGLNYCDRQEIAADQYWADQEYYFGRDD